VLNRVLVAILRGRRKAGKRGRNENLRKERKEKYGRDGINISSEINFWLWPAGALALPLFHSVRW